MSKMASQTPKNKKHFRWSKLLLLLLAVFIVAKLGQQYQRYGDIHAEVEYQRQQLEIAQNDYESLQGQVQLLYRDSYLEQLARSSLGMVKAGEVVVSPAEVGDVPEIKAKVNEKDIFH